MQEVNKTRCDSMPIGAVGRLQDTRDQKWYWVTRLDDGLCWMTQNLDYNYGTIATSFTSSNQNTRQYYDPGEYVFINTPGASNCNNQTLADGFINCKKWKLKDEVSNTDLPDYVDVSNWRETDDVYFVSSTEYVGTDGVSICKKVAGSLIGDAEHNQCRIYYYLYLSPYFYEHYSVGNFYNWEAASMVCPSGWGLPTGAKNGSINYGELYIMMGLRGDRLLTDMPYTFVRPGQINNTSFIQIDVASAYWSGTTYGSNNDRAYILDTNGYQVNSPLYLYYGGSVRCVAR